MNDSRQDVDERRQNPVSDPLDGSHPLDLHPRLSFRPPSLLHFRYVPRIGRSYYKLRRECGPRGIGERGDRVDSGPFGFRAIAI